MDTELPPQESEGKVKEWKFCPLIFLRVIHHDLWSVSVSLCHSYCVSMNIHSLFFCLSVQTSSRI